MNQVNCECGYSTQSADEEQLVSTVLEHVSAAHPDLVATVTPDVIKGWIEVVS